MPRKRYSTEQIITKLRQAEVELSRGLRTPQVCKKLGISEQTYYRWRKEDGGLRLDQAKRLKALEQENVRLKKLVADRFESRVLPLFKRRTEDGGRLLPELYLHGLAEGDFDLALRGLLGDGAPLSARPSVGS